MKKHMMLILTIMLAICLGGCSFSLGGNNENNTPFDNTNNANLEEQSYDLTKAKELIDRYYSVSLVEVGMNQDMEFNIAYRNSQDKIVLKDCNELYANNNKVKKEENTTNSYVIFSDEHWAACDGQAQVVSYSDLNTKYKELFGQDKNLDKSDYFIGYSSYDYDEVTDMFVSLSCRCGGIASINKTSFNVKSAYTKGDNLIVDVGYYVFEYVNTDNYKYYSSISKKTYTAEELTDDFIANFFNEYKDSISTYRFTFKLENDHYVFDSLIQVLS